MLENAKFTLIPKKFGEINSLVTSLVGFINFKKEKERISIISHCGLITKKINFTEFILESSKF